MRADPAGPAEEISETLHASSVALDGRGVLILGPSGSGKSTLALTLMAMGAELVADDRTLIRRQGDQLVASSPDTIRGLIEARGIGLLNATATGSAALCLAVDLGQREPDRLPPRRSIILLGLSIALVHGAGNPHLAPAILQYLKAGRGA